MEEIVNKKKGGRPRKAPETPEDLIQGFEGYRAECREDGFTDPRSGAIVPTPLTRVGFMDYLGLGYRWNDFKAYYMQKEGFSVVITRIENAIERNQLEGALVGVYTPNLVARLNGYTEKTDNKHDVRGGFVWKEIE